MIGLVLNGFCSRTVIGFVSVVVYESNGGLGNNDDDGSENITKKINLRSFKLYRVYLEPFNSSSVGDFSRRWILKAFIYIQIEKGEFVVVCPRSP